MKAMWAHARWELRLLLRNGEQLLLLFVIPLVLLLALHLAFGRPLIQAVPQVITVSLLASCFTSLAIGTAFERRSGALRYLATTPLTRGQLVSGKALATGVLALASLATVCVVAAFLGWNPASNSAWWPLLAALSLVLGAAAFASWGAVLAGTLRAEAVLAVANGLFLLLLLFGGVAIPAASMPPLADRIVSTLPTAALAQSLMASLAAGPVSVWPLLILAGWTAVGFLVARTRFSFD